MSGRSAKIKGSQFERDCVHFLNSVGLNARRQPYSGATEHFKGDVQFLVRGEKKRGECKRRARAYKGIYDALGQNFVLFVRDDRTPPLAIMRLEHFGELAK